MGKTIIGVMGPGEGATGREINQATKLGRLIAIEGWVLLTGGRKSGVMDAASKGAQQAGGLTIGLLPSDDGHDASKYLDIPIRTGMGSARNNINVLSSDVVVACGSGAGTASEIMLAMKAGKPLVLLNPPSELVDFIKTLPYPEPALVKSAEEAIKFIRKKI
jgi:uncharacterized protein (TIGR00725 family)